MGECISRFIGDSNCDGSCPVGQSCQDCECVALSPSIGFSILEQGLMNLTGAATLSIPYILSASGNTRFLQFEQSALVVATANAQFFQNNFIPVGSRPNFGNEIVFGFVSVLNNGELEFARIIIDSSGTISFSANFDPSSEFDTGITGINGGYIQWNLV